MCSRHVFKKKKKEILVLNNKPDAKRAAEKYKKKIPDSQKPKKN